jgi:hypothetical protein
MGICGTVAGLGCADTACVVNRNTKNVKIGLIVICFGLERNAKFKAFIIR